MSVIESLRTKKISINQIISLVILVVAGLVAMNISQKQNKKINQLRQVQDEQKKKSDILLRVEDLKKRIEFYKQTFKPKDNREIINTITNLAAATGVEIVSLKPQMTSNGDRGKGVTIYNKNFFHLAIRVSGYHQLGEFISKLENNPMMFIIEALEVQNIQGVSAGLSTEAEKLQIGLIISVLSFQA